MKYFEFCLPKKIEKFLALYRKCLYWQRVKTGAKVPEIPMETQWLLVQYVDNRYGLVIPLVGTDYRCTLEGSRETLMICCETEKTEISEEEAVYYAEGDNPYFMMKEAGKKLAQFLPNLRTIEQKQIPEFVKYFGWCTWDSFYFDVKQEDIRSGLQDFKDGGVIPKLVILDSGWQSLEPVYEKRLYNPLHTILPNEKFGYDLTETVNIAKKEFGVKQFFVWHALNGYWGGVDAYSQEMKEFGVKTTKLQYPQKLMENPDFHIAEIKPEYGYIDPKKSFDFYDTLHSSLRGYGVDGVKIDVQGMIEGVAIEEGGVAAVTDDYRKSMEASTAKNFNGNLINCMSCSNMNILNSLYSAVMRSSDDFYPKVKSTHGGHVMTNAFASMFMGEFLICDWDMFQTRHEYGAFHAAARAISGGPVYVSDKVGEHDFDIIRRLVLADGTLPLCKRAGRPCRDSLFLDVEERSELFKIFNYNEYNAVIGAFNLALEGTLSKRISPCDVEGYTTGDYVVYDERYNRLVKMNDGESLLCTLDAVNWN